MTMNTADYLQLLRQYKESASKKYGIKRIGIFGSVARGEQTENSDVDIVRERDDMDLLLKNCILRDGIFA